MDSEDLNKRSHFVFIKSSTGEFEITDDEDASWKILEDEIVKMKSGDKTSYLMRIANRSQYIRSGKDELYYTECEHCGDYYWAGDAVIARLLKKLVKSGKIADMPIELNPECD